MAAEWCYQQPFDTVWTFTLILDGGITEPADIWEEVRCSRHLLLLHVCPRFKTQTQQPQEVSQGLVEQSLNSFILLALKLTFPLRST